MSIKIHIAVALLAATGAVLILSLLVIAQSAHDSAESLSSHRQALTFLHINPDTLRMAPPATMRAPATTA
jgi:hypothetical protein